MKTYRYKSTASSTVEVFLREICKLHPRSELKRLFKEKYILVNGRPVSRLVALKNGDRIDILHSENLYSETHSPIIPNPHLDLDVVAEEADYVVVSKEAGVHSHPIKRSDSNTLINAIAARYPECAQNMRKKRPLEGGLLHRLDEGTSGLIVCARQVDAFEKLQALWAGRALTKIYLAWLDGIFVNAGTLTSLLKHDPKSKKRMRVYETKSPKARSKNDGWEAKTSVYPISHNHNRTLSLIQIHTGVTHQIRATMAALGAPVLGDPLYYSKEKRITPKLAGLERSQLELFHELKNNLKSSSWNPPVASKKAGFFYLHALYLSLPEPYGKTYFSNPPDYFRGTSR